MVNQAVTLKDAGHERQAETDAAFELGGWTRRQAGQLCWGRLQLYSTNLNNSIIAI